MSSITSPSEFGSVPGELVPPSTPTAVTLGVVRSRLLKYVSRSAWLKPPPSSRIAAVWPEPVAPDGKSYAAATCGGVYDVAVADFAARAQMRPRLRTFVDPEHAGDHATELGRNRQRPLAAAEPARGSGAHTAEGPAPRTHPRTPAPCHGATRPDVPGRPRPPRARIRRQTIAPRRCLHRSRHAHRRAPRAKSCAARPGPPGLLIDPVKRRRRPQVHGHLDRLVSVDLSDALILRTGLPSAARNLHTLCHHRVLSLNGPRPSVAPLRSTLPPLANDKVLAQSYAR